MSTRSKWSVHELSELAQFHSGGTPSKARVEFWGDGIPWITASDLKRLHQKKFLQTLTPHGAQTVRVMPAGAIYILVRGMALFKDLPVAFVDQPAAFNQDIKALIAAPGIDSEFLAYALVAHKDAIRQLVDQAGHGTGRLDTELLKAFPISVPPLPEQRKIAEILRTWDDAIEAVTAVQKLSTVKLSRQSAELLALDPQDNSNRQTFRLGELFTERNEPGANNDVLLSVTQSDGIVNQQTVGRKDSSSADRSKYKLVLAGDIAYNTMRMWQGASGLANTRGVVSPAYTVITPHNGRINPQYAANLFKTDEMKFVFERYSQGLTSDTWNLKFPAFARIEVQIPSPQQQVSIAVYLDQARQEIAVYGRLASAFRSQKRALMQKLLTGQIRVNVDEESDVRH